MRRVRSSTESKTTARPVCAISAWRRRRLLDDRAARRQVAAQHGDAAARIDRLGGRADHVLAGDALGAFGIRAQRRAGHRRRVEVEQRRRARRSRRGTPPAQWKCSM